MDSVLRILMLEDSPYDADLIARELRKEGVDFEYKVVSSKQEFEETLETFTPHIVLSDHSLPRFNSLEALTLLQKFEALRHLTIPFILVTGTVSEDFAAKCIKAGANDYVLKDRLKRLPSAIQSALEKSKLEHEQSRLASQLRSISRYSIDVLCSLDERGQFLYVSDASRKLWGYDPEEMIGKSFSDYIYHEDVTATIGIAQALRRGEQINRFENRYKRKDGSLVPLIWSFRWEESERTFFCIAKDATEQIQARQKIEESKKQYEYLVHHLPAPLYTCDTSGHITLYNKAAIELWGREPDLSKDLWCGSLRAFSHDGVLIAPDECPMARSIKTGKPITGEEIIIERPDGTRRHIIPYPSPQFDVTGHVTGGMNVLIDITESKKQLEFIENQNTKFRRIAWSQSHEVRAPLARIMGLVSLLNHERTTDAEEKHLFDHILTSAQELDQIIRRIVRLTEEVDRK